MQIYVKSTYHSMVCDNGQMYCIVLYCIVLFFIAPSWGEFDVWIPVPTCSPIGALIIFFSFSCAHICMSRQSQILFLSDVGIF